ncbi:MAG: FixH family protein [Gammaproteobacteria bacterium]|nr:FixH family protein [Gammaproteobacteria bacterium]
MNMANKNSAWRSPWVIGWVAMVAIFFTMNLIMIFLTVNNDSGLVVEDFYERGQDYEKNMLKRLARDPGWQMEVQLPKKIEIDQSVLCRFVVKDKMGEAVTPDAVILYVYRPSNAKQDFSIPMKAVEPGVYETQVSFPLIGAWDMLVSAKLGEDEFNTPKRVGVGIDWQP